MQSLECVELPLFVLLPKMSVPDIKNLGLQSVTSYDMEPHVKSLNIVDLVATDVVLNITHDL